mmetsp:Transcript_11128/g.33364  ORF Transcript_11128/g.33364 Transcript_11128/m.33364 type:complete len:778 (+) Transcript_11128:428-2761(+)
MMVRLPDCQKIVVRQTSKASASLPCCCGCCSTSLMRGEHSHLLLLQAAASDGLPRKAGAGGAHGGVLDADHGGASQGGGARLAGRHQGPCHGGAPQRVGVPAGTHPTHSVLVGVLGSDLAAVLAQLVLRHVAHAVLVQDPHHGPLDGVQPNVPDQGPDDGDDDVVGAADDGGTVQSLGVGLGCDAGEGKHLVATAVAAEFAVVHDVCGLHIAVKAQGSNEQSSNLGGEESDVSEAAGDDSEGVLGGTNHKHHGLTAEGHLGVQKGAGHGLAHVLLLHNTLVQQRWGGALPVNVRVSASGCAGHRGAHSAEARAGDGEAAAVVLQVGAGLVAQVVHLELALEERGVGGHVVQHPGGQGEVQSVYDADDEDAGQRPVVGQAGGHHLVLGECDHGTVIEDGQQHDEHGGEVEVVDDRQQTEGEADTEGHGDSVLGVGRHALEDLAGTDDGGDDDRQTSLGEHNVGGTASGVSGAVHSNAHVGLLQSRGIVYTVTSHAHHVVALLQDVDDLVLVLREHFSKAVSVLHKLAQLLLVFHVLEEGLGGVHVGAHAQLAGGLLANEQLVAGDHLDVDALLSAGLHGGLGVVARRVEQGQQAHELPSGVAAVIALSHGEAQGAVATAGKLGDLALHVVLDVSHIVAIPEHHLGGTLHEAVRLATLVVRQHGGDGVLVGGVERHELDLLVVVPQGLVAVVGLVHDDVNGLLRGDVGGQSAVLQGLLGGHALGHHDHVGLVDGELVESEGAGLVGAQNVHASHLLHGGHARHDGALLGKLEGAQGEGD